MQVKVLHRDWSHVVEFLLQLENKQQIKQNNVETQHKCKYSCIHNILVSVVCVRYMYHFLTSICENLNAMKHSI